MMESCAVWTRLWQLHPLRLEGWEAKGWGDAACWMHLKGSVVCWKGHWIHRK